MVGHSSTSISSNRRPSGSHSAVSSTKPRRTTAQEPTKAPCSRSNSPCSAEGLALSTFESQLISGRRRQGCLRHSYRRFDHPQRQSGRRWTCGFTCGRSTRTARSPRSATSATWLVTNFRSRVEAAAANRMTAKSRSRQRSDRRADADRASDDDVDHATGDDDDLLRRRPAEHVAILGSASAAASTPAASRSAATVMWPRTLPLTCTGYSTVSATSIAGSATGNGSWASDASWPSLAHSSSATCAASGATISTNGSAIVGRAATQLGEVVVQLDQLGDGGVEPQGLHVVAHTR